MTKLKSKTILVSVILIVLGLIVFIPTIALASHISQSLLLIIRIITSISLLIVSMIFKKSSKLSKFWKLPFLFFIASISLSISWFLASYPRKWLGLSLTTAEGIAFAKFFEAFLIVIPLLIISKLSGFSFNSIYLKKGKLKLGIIIGIISFIFMYIISFFQAKNGGYLEYFLKSSPWLFIFCFSNAFMEELIFRGIFLKEFEIFIGKRFANLVLAIVFTAAHIKVTYTPDLVIFLSVLFVSALIWGYLIQKTESLVASILFHAGADVLIFVGIAASLGGKI